jgi:hypothetical protein
LKLEIDTEVYASAYEQGQDGLVATWYSIEGNLQVELDNKKLILIINTLNMCTY